MQVGEVGPTGEIDGQRRPLSRAAVSQRQEVGDRGGARRLAVQCLAYGGAHLGGAVVVEQGQELGGLAADGLAAGAGGLEEGFDLGDRAQEAGVGGMTQGAPLVFQQGLFVGGVGDFFVAAVATRVASDLAGAVEDADGEIGRASCRERVSIAV